MQNSITINGTWWLPQTPENILFGNLTRSEDSWLELDLKGTFESHQESKPKDPEIIFGKTEKNEYIILKGNHLVKRKFGLDFDEGKYKYNSSIINSQIAILSHDDLHQEPNHSYRFQSLSVTLSELSSWILKQSFTLKKLESQSIEIELAHQEKFIMRWEEFEISFITFTDHTDDIYSKFELNTSSQLIVKSDEIKELDELLNVASQIRDFINFATTGNAQFLMFTGSLEISSSLSAQCKIYYPGLTITEKPKEVFRKSKHLLPHEKIEPNLEILLGNWLTAYNGKLGPMLLLYSATMRNMSHAYIQTTFLSLIQALESYVRRVAEAENEYQKSSQFKNGIYKSFKQVIDKSSIEDDFKEHLKIVLRTSNKLSLKNQLQNIIHENLKDVPINFLNSQEDTENFIHEAVNFRNYRTHLYPEGDKKFNWTPAQIYDFSKKLELILTLLILKEINLPEEQLWQLTVNNTGWKLNYLMN